MLGLLESLWRNVTPTGLLIAIWNLSAKEDTVTGSGLPMLITSGIGSSLLMSLTKASMASLIRAREPEGYTFCRFQRFENFIHLGKGILVLIEKLSKRARL